MSPPTATEQQLCSRGIRCRHKGLPISIDRFRKGDTLPHCYLFHKTCNYCRSTRGRIAKAYALPRNVPPPSPPGIPKKKCRKCRREWSLSRFIVDAGEQCPECEFCRGSNQALSLPKSGFPQLNNQQKDQLQKRWENCKHIILDEKSMVGRKLLSRMDARLRDAFPKKQNEMFGGCSILLFGDFGQLHPVGDAPLFNLRPQVRGNSEAVLASNKGRALYMSLTESITLDRIMRQRGGGGGRDPTAVQFRQVLSNLQSMEATEADRHFLNTRYIGNSSEQELTGFEDALYLCPTNALVDEINESKMSRSGKPVLTLPARNKGPGAGNASDDEAEGLAEKLLLMEGAKVMLSRNIWTTQGLTNGSMGTIGTIFPEI